MRSWISASRSILAPQSQLLLSYTLRYSHFGACSATRHAFDAFVSCRHASTGSQSLSKTTLHDLHVKDGGKMVSFAGYSMPVYYSDLSVSESHKWTRQKASIFDVGHMVQHRLSGPSATSLLSKITPTSLDSLQNFHSTLSCLLLPENGGIVDDTVITRLGPDQYYLVTNAACREKDIRFLETEIKGGDFGDLKWKILNEWGLIALQGPLSVDILNGVIASSTAVNLETLYFGQAIEARIDLGSGRISESVLISRGGYTGEDGFEISIPPADTVDVTARLFKEGGQERLRWAGLGARDSLRLEAGMCLYGHDLDEKTTPVEAGLSWVVGKDRRLAGDFNGAHVIIPQLKSKGAGGTGVERRRVGLVIQGAPAREGAVILGGGDEIGEVTSGSPSPSLGKNIAMGYIKQGWHKTGTKVEVVVRGKRREGIVTKMPFVPSQYWKERTGTAPT